MNDSASDSSRTHAPFELAEIVHEKPLSGEFDEVLFGSDRGNTLWVKFSDRNHGAAWVGKFGCGWSSEMRVTVAAAPDRFMVAAGGHAYVVDATQRRLLNQFSDTDAHDVAYLAARNAFVVAGYSGLRLVEGGQTTWTSREIALDGITNLSVEGDLVRGVAVTGYNSEEKAFSIKLGSDEVTYQAIAPRQENAPAPPASIAKHKPWWRFW